MAKDPITTAIAEAMRIVVREEIERATGLASKPDKLWLNKAEAAALLGVTPRTVTNLIARGLPYHRLGRTTRFKSEDLQAYVETGPRLLRRVK